MHSKQTTEFIAHLMQHARYVLAFERIAMKKGGYAPNTLNVMGCSIQDDVVRFGINLCGDDYDTVIPHTVPLYMFELVLESITEEEVLAEFNSTNECGTESLKTEYQLGFEDGCAHIKEDYAAGHRLDERAKKNNNDTEPSPEKPAFKMVGKSISDVFEPAAAPSFKQHVLAHYEDASVLRGLLEGFDFKVLQENNVATPAGVVYYGYVADEKGVKISFEVYEDATFGEDVEPIQMSITVGYDELEAAYARYLRVT